MSGETTQRCAGFQAKPKDVRHGDGVGGKGGDRDVVAHAEDLAARECLAIVFRVPLENSIEEVHDKITRRHLPRLGQGAFRLMVMNAYDRRCAITGERTLPALDAAHIRPFREQESHEVQNGILMRSDIHRLFDQGYVTVTPDLRFRVSPKIRDQFNNGIIYYDLDQRPVRVPEAEEQKPDVSALEWHSSSLYRG